MSEENQPGITVWKSIDDMRRKTVYISWQPSGALRFVQGHNDDIEPATLQQEWIDTGSGRREWRDVPTVYTAKTERE